MTIGSGSGFCCWPQWDSSAEESEERYLTAGAKPAELAEPAVNPAQGRPVDTCTGSSDEGIKRMISEKHLLK